MAHDIFISYAPADRAVAEIVCDRLETAGVACWIAPRDIGGGADWDSAIEDARLVVLVFSAAANVSRQVRDEVALAVETGAGLILFRIDSAEPTGALRLRIVQRPWIDAITPPLEPHVDRLIEQARRMLPAGQPTIGLEETEPVAVPV
ncbi:MAG: toll/interleukin-1 receptor domain-containing protein, partial [Xanthobacteraceae bacterium]|nr:toll/interleukin-1 receptor domain-containing protein [Xanthobacteraceae bacterium]